jgi:hypothetical protein
VTAKLFPQRQPVFQAGSFTESPKSVVLLIFSYPNQAAVPLETLGKTVSVRLLLSVQPTTGR